MAAFCIHYLRAVGRMSVSLAKSPPVDSFTPRLFSHDASFMWGTFTTLHFPSPSRPLFLYRNYRRRPERPQRGVNLVVDQGKAKFEVHEAEETRKEKCLRMFRFKTQKRRERRKRQAAIRLDPRRRCLIRKKQKFPNVDDRIKDKIKRARAKEYFLIKSLKEFEVPKVQGPVVKPHELTGEEKFYFKKMAQKGSNYVPVGRRGVFGGVILNMHLHWKKHETVKVYFKPCKPGQLKEYIQEIERLSGGISIQTIDKDTAVFYRGKDYVQPEVMSPVHTLSKRKALEKSKLEQALETVRHYVAVLEKELELYYRHIALYGTNESNQSSNMVAQNRRDYAKKAFNSQFAVSKRLGSSCDSARRDYAKKAFNSQFAVSKRLGSSCDSARISGLDYDSSDEELISMESSDTEQDDSCISGGKAQDPKELINIFSKIAEKLAD